jgi:hypothetical protein
MQTTPIYNWPYPEPEDHTRTWEYWQGLAMAIETTIRPKVAENLTVTSVASGWSVTASGVKSGSLAAVQIDATPPSSFANVTGNLAPNVFICTLPANWRPSNVGSNMIMNDILAVATAEVYGVVALGGIAFPWGNYSRSFYGMWITGNPSL